MKFSQTLAILIASALLFFSVRFLSNSDGTGRVIDSTKLLMGSFVQIKVPIYGRVDERSGKKAIDKAFEEIARLEALFSAFKEESELSKINRMNANETFKPSAEVFDLIERDIEYNEKTKGAFDITVKPLVDLWARSKNEKKLPSHADIKKELTRIGTRYIILDKLNKSVSFNREGVKIDLGGAAQGYATDRAIKVLKENGIENALVNLGGDMYCMGRKSKDEPWNVGIQHPRNKNKLFFEVRLEDKAINTSGDYEKYFILNGTRYSHIIDPRTGYPVGGNVVSATIIDDDSTRADMLATALCVLGREGLGAVESIKGADAILIIKDKGALKIEMTRGLRERYAVQEK